MTNDPSEVTASKFIERKAKPPYVFVSHDTRDSDVAEAFSKLLSNVTAGVLKCFRSSDKKGGHGIEFGVEWFPELMKKLQEASDVVCLLTENSINRPWILFEAGVAKGKLDTPIRGLAVNIPLTAANTGPFAQFQNSDDEEDSLVKLVIQLVKKVPGAEPDESVVRQQVQSFKTRVTEHLSKKTKTPKELKKEDVESTSVAKLFEEVKVMFADLPARLEAQSLTLRRRLPRRFSPGATEELIYQGLQINPITGFLVVLSLVRDDFPWIYDLGHEVVNAIRKSSAFGVEELISEFHRTVEFTTHSRAMHEAFDRSDFIPVDMLVSFLHRTVEELPGPVRKYHTVTKKANKGKRRVRKTPS